jgi:hypothetical protein
MPQHFEETEKLLGCINVHGVNNANWIKLIKLAESLAHEPSFLEVEIATEN